MVDTKSRFKLKKDLKYENVSKKQFCIDFQQKNDAGKNQLIFNRKMIGFSYKMAISKVQQNHRKMSLKIPI